MLDCGIYDLFRRHEIRFRCLTGYSKPDSGRQLQQAANQPRYCTISGCINRNVPR
ncbi:hypothetical protein ApDm4_0960 [Acetobacter pomorum]|nr:hypothetical protein ApDm4_0960 [Acetobacter pomorum]